MELWWEIITFPKAKRINQNLARHWLNSPSPSHTDYGTFLHSPIGVSLEEQKLLVCHLSCPSCVLSCSDPCLLTPMGFERGWGIFFPPVLDQTVLPGLSQSDLLSFCPFYKSPSDWVALASFWLFQARSGGCYLPCQWALLLRGYHFVPSKISFASLASPKLSSPKEREKGLQSTGNMRKMPKATEIQDICRFLRTFSDSTRQKDLYSPSCLVSFYFINWDFVLLIMVSGSYSSNTIPITSVPTSLS